MPITKPLGADVPIIWTVREQALDDADGRLFSPLSAQLQGIFDEDGANVLGGTASFRWIGPGRGVYWWDTSGESVGVYRVEIQFTLSNTGEAEHASQRFRLVEGGS